jgi:predicted DNA-binding protein (MmcQ/YjbR family)
MADSTLKRISDICLSLPDTKLTMTWGEPHFRVGEKIFCGYGGKKGQPTIGFKLEMEHADILVNSDPRFARAPYVGHKGWVSLDAKFIKDWAEVRALVLESYRLIAPKKTLAKLDAAPVSVRKTSRKKAR